MRETSPVSTQLSRPPVAAVQIMWHGKAVRREDCNILAKMPVSLPRKRRISRTNQVRHIFTRLLVRFHHHILFSTHAASLMLCPIATHTQLTDIMTYKYWGSARVITPLAFTRCAAAAVTVFSAFTQGFSHTIKGSCGAIKSYTSIINDLARSHPLFVCHSTP